MTKKPCLPQRAQRRHRGHGDVSGTLSPIPSQRMQVGEEIVELLLSERAADGGHHIAAGENGLPHESFVGGKPAGQKWFLEDPFQAGTVLSRDRMRVMARCAILL